MHQGSVHYRQLAVSCLRKVYFTLANRLFTRLKELCAVAGLKACFMSLFISEKKSSQLSRLVCPSWAQTLQWRIERDSFLSVFPLKYSFMWWKRSRAFSKAQNDVCNIYFCLQIKARYTSQFEFKFREPSAACEAQTGAAQYYNTICMLKGWPLLFGCVSKCESLCVCVCVCVYVHIDQRRMCRWQGSLSGHCVGEGRLLAFNPLLTNLISRGS